MQEIIKKYGLDESEVKVINDTLKLNNNHITSFVLRAQMHRGWAVCSRIADDLIEKGIAKELPKGQKMYLPNDNESESAKILLVEDDKALAKAYKTRLQEEGYTIELAYNGSKALEAAVKFKPDLIITGILMPKISGFDVIDILKNTDETKHIPILVLSALKQPRDTEKARQLGATDYMCKSEAVVADVISVIEAILTNTDYTPFSYADGVKEESKNASGNRFSSVFNSVIKERRIKFFKKSKTKASKRSENFPLSILSQGTTQYKKNTPSISQYTKTVEEVVESTGCEVEFESSSDAPRFYQLVYKPIKGGKVQNIEKLERAIAQKLDADSLRVIIGKKLNSRIEVQIGKTADNRLVTLREALESTEFQLAKSPLAFPVGMDANGKIVVADFKTLPHLLTAGQTGSGKSNFTEAVLIPSLLYKNSPEDLQLLLVDPKWVQYTAYNRLPHLARPIINKPDDCRDAFEWLLQELGNRFKILEEHKVKNIEELNETGDAHLPYIVIIIDEFVDLMMVDSKYYEKAFLKILQLGRAVGIHLYIGTSRPSTDVVTGMLKANFPSRIAFTTASVVDSQTIIDTKGAERLLGRGDLLFCSMEHPVPIRLQAPFGDDSDVDVIVNHMMSNK